MPRGDGTGPLGMGAMTGKRAGFCTGLAAPGQIKPGLGIGMGLGRGRGLGRKLRITGMPGRTSLGYPEYSGAFAPEADEKEYLNNRAGILENQLQQVKKRLKALNDEAE